MVVTKTEVRKAGKSRELCTTWGQVSTLLWTIVQK